MTDEEWNVLPKYNGFTYKRLDELIEFVKKGKNTDDQYMQWKLVSDLLDDVRRLQKQCCNLKKKLKKQKDFVDEMFDAQ